MHGPVKKAATAMVVGIAPMRSVPFAFDRESQIPPSTLHDHHAEFLLQTPDRR
jgi:hypothetical protein